MTCQANLTELYTRLGQIEVALNSLEDNKELLEALSTVQNEVDLLVESADFA